MQMLLELFAELVIDHVALRVESREKIPVTRFFEQTIRSPMPADRRV